MILSRSNSRKKISFDIVVRVTANFGADMVFTNTYNYFHEILDDRNPS